MAVVGCCSGSPIRTGFRPSVVCWASTGIPAASPPTAAPSRRASRAWNENWACTPPAARGMPPASPPRRSPAGASTWDGIPRLWCQASRLSAKVDNSAVQGGHQLYHHSFFYTADGRWCVVQQGMDDAAGTARRYHWLGERVVDFSEEPHAAVCRQAPAATLNLVDRENRAARQAIVAVTCQLPAP